jgi:hypothetical protein
MGTLEAINLALALANGLGKAFGDIWAIFREQRPELVDEDIPDAAAAYVRARDLALGAADPKASPR